MAKKKRAMARQKKKAPGLAALVSPRAGLALIKDGENFLALSAHGDGRAVPCGGREVNAALRNAEDAYSLEAGSVAEVFAELKRERALVDALDMSLFLLDPTLQDQTRMKAAQVLDDLLARDWLRDSLATIFVLQPPSREMDLPGGLALAIARGADRARDFTARLLEQGAALARVRRAWQSALEKGDFSREVREELPGRAIRQGVLGSLWAALAAGQDPALWSAGAVGSLGSHLQLKKMVARLAAGLRAAPLELAQAEEREQGREERKLDLPAIMAEVERRKGNIAQAMQRGDQELLQGQLEELVSFHMENGGGEFAAKSLCHLASQAKELQHYQMQLSLVEKARNLSPGDAHCANQYADALLQNGELVKALQAYEAAGAAHPQDEVARNGRAEVLRELGRYEEALAAYDETIAAHPQNEVARNGRAEVLRELGRHEEALAAYNETIAAHPQNEVAKNGRAEVLRELGRHEEALAAYEETIAAHPQNAFGKSGRAEVLRELGCHEEALAAYEQAIAAHPENVVAKNGRAEVLRELGRYDEALAAYEQAIAAHPRDAVAKNGRAEVLRELGRYEEALAAYEQAIAAHPQNVVAKTGRAEVLRELGRYGEALAAYEAAIAAHPQNVVAMCGRAEVLRELGRYDEALTAYEQAVATHPQDAFGKTGRAEVLRELDRYDEALVAYAETIAAHPQNAVAKSGRAEVLRELGRYEEALDAYEEIMAAHPQDVFAKTGRAEVLRELDRYDEALVAYAETIAAHPQDAFAKNGRANILAQLGRFREALLALPAFQGGGVNWVSEHLKGMILLRLGQTEEALSTLARGARECPMPRQREYFVNGLALCHLQMARYDEALQTVRTMQSGEFAAGRRLVASVALLGQGRPGEARDELDLLEEQEAPLCREAMGELRRYADSGVKEQAAQKEIMQKAVACVLVLATIAMQRQPGQVGRLSAR